MRSYLFVLSYLLLTFLYVYQRIIALKHLGKVMDAELKRGLENVSVNIYDTEYRTLRATTVTDNKGNFNLYVQKGKYYATAQKEGFELVEEGAKILPKISRKTYRGGIIELKEPGYLPIILEMKRLKTKY
jgi:hypothetical protein